MNIFSRIGLVYLLAGWIVVGFIQEPIISTALFGVAIGLFMAELIHDLRGFFNADRTNSKLPGS